jgi:hypothetical protein
MPTEVYLAALASIVFAIGACRSPMWASTGRRVRRDSSRKALTGQCRIVDLHTEAGNCGKWLFIRGERTWKRPGSSVVAARCGLKYPSFSVSAKPFPENAAVIRVSLA